MKLITVLAATALAFGVTAASAQAPSSGASKPGATTNTDPEVPAAGVSRSNSPRATGQATPRRAPSTTGYGGSSVTPGSNPNPPQNRNPDPEVPGHPE